MLRIEADLFSGRPNPVWMVTDADAGDALLRSVSGAPEAVAKPGAGFDGLGYREVRVSVVHDDEPRRRGVPREFALGSTAAADPAASGDLARRFVETMLSSTDVRLLQHEHTPLDQRMQELILEGMERLLANPPQPGPPPRPPGKNPLRTTVQDGKCEKCAYEVSQYNPGFWNTSPFVRANNNCYNYARNWRTDTFAQPGRAHGAGTNTMQCPEVTTAAMADGLKKRCDCLSEKEYPRRLMALVVGPDYDYHWYREQRDGFWGHKPGQTAARNTDENGALVVDPETAARGPYTDFCGYFYAGRSVVIN
jgi:hypothetical protein